MTIAEFELLPMKLGWKYEYWDGQAHISPGYQVVTVTIEVKPRPVNSQFRLRPIDARAEAQLVTAYLAAFRDAIEYCDWEPEQIQVSAHDTIQGFLAGKRGQPLPISRVAINSQAESGAEYIIGAALLVEKKDGRPLLDILFVVPEWQRQGLATALVSEAVNELVGSGAETLESRYMLGNDGSSAWHQRFGFVEEPDLLLVRQFYRHAQHELWRREKFGDLTETERQVQIAEVQQWKLRIEELELIAEQHGMEAVLPLLR